MEIMMWLTVVAVLAWSGVAYWTQPDGLCYSNFTIDHPEGMLSTWGLYPQGNNVTCQWEITPASAASSHVYVLISGSASEGDTFSINGVPFSQASNEFGSYLSPLVVSFARGNSSDLKGFTLYWQIWKEGGDRMQLINLFLATNGGEWIVSWELGKHHCTWFGVQCVGNFSVENLTLPSNNLNGFIPKDFYLPLLAHLDLSNNNIRGVVPSSIMYNTPKECDLNGNSFCGGVFAPSCFEVGYDLCSNHGFISSASLPPSNYTFSNKSTSSPFVQVLSSRKEANLTLQATYNRVVVSGVIADIKMVQVYVNSGNTSISVYYYFPSSPTAVVYGMQFINHGKLVIAQLKTSEEAHRIYNISEESGKTTVILENNSGSILKLKIANIPPKSTLRVEIFFTEQLIPEQGLYSFYFPSLLPPQYLNDVEGVYQDPYSFQCIFIMDILIQLPLPISNISCPTHHIDITTTHNTAETQFSTIGLIDDFLLQYSMNGNEILAGVLLYDPEMSTSVFDNPISYADDTQIKFLNFEEKFFMSIIESPSMDFVDPLIVPREYIFILDTSASMTGRPAKIATYLINSLLSLLNPDVDIFNIITFSSESTFFSKESILATPENLTSAISWISKTTTGGFSDLFSALPLAVSIPKTRNYSRIITTITDGLIPIKKESLYFIKEQTQNANFYAIAIGAVPNRYLTQGIATVGKGREFWIQKESDVHQISQKFIRHVLSPVLINITLDFNPDFHVDLSSLSSFSDVTSDRPLIISGKYNGTIPDGKMFTINGLVSNGIPWKKDVFPTLLSTANPKSIVYLWAGSRIRELEFTSLPQDITDLSLNYHILSKFTSFIAVGTGVTIPWYNITSPIGMETSPQYNCQADCPEPYCPGKCYPSFDGSTDYCPLSSCSDGEYCLNGDCIPGDPSFCNCEESCAPFICNGAMCPYACPNLDQICSHNGTCYFDLTPVSCCTGLCNAAALDCSPDCPIQCPPGEVCDKGNCACSPNCVLKCAPSMSCDKMCPDICPINYACVDGVCYSSTLINYFHAESSLSPILSCSGIICDPLAICDPSLYTCIHLVQNISIDCEGELIGNQSFICDNGNYIYLSTSIITSPNFSLNGILAVEGDLHLVSSTILMTIRSFISAAQVVTIPPQSNLIINFLNLSFDTLGEIIINETDGTKSVQIIQSPSFIENIDTLQVSLINNPNTICDYSLKQSTGLMLSLSLQCDKSDESGNRTLKVVMGVVFGVLGILVVIGGIVSHVSFKRIDAVYLNRKPIPLNTP